MRRILDKKIKARLEIYFLILTLALIALPFFASAQVSDPANSGSRFWKPLIICGEINNPCNFGKLVELTNNIITDLVVISFPLAALSFAWAGFLILTSAGNMAKVSQGKAILLKVGTGFVIILSAFLVVSFIISTFVNQNSIINIIQTR
ncbi:MAG: pilin [Minisyncoccia bacterium]